MRILAFSKSVFCHMQISIDQLYRDMGQNEGQADALLSGPCDLTKNNMASIRGTNRINKIK